MSAKIETISTDAVLMATSSTQHTVASNTITNYYICQLCGAQYSNMSGHICLSKKQYYWTPCTVCGGLYPPPGPHLCTGTATMPLVPVTYTQAGAKTDYNIIVNKFSARTKCPKCLSSSFKVEYCTKYSDAIAKGTAAPPTYTTTTTYNDCTYRAGYREHLHIKCDRCAYAWTLLTADAKEDDDGKGDL